MKIIYILQASSHARYWRRIDKLRELGIKSTVFAFERENFYEGTKGGRQYKSLGNIEQENYKRRIFPLINSIKTIRGELKEADVVYTFGMDTFIIGWAATLFKGNKPKFVYEVGDIRTVFTNKGIIPKIFRAFEKFILKRTDLLVVTSEAYVHGYFKGIQKLNKLNYHVIENKPELKLNVSDINHEKSDNQKIRIGYFGVLRCSRTLEVLKKLIIEHGDKFELYIRGIITQGKDIVNDIMLLDNVKAEGEYKVPDDLTSMYNQIDIIWACYPYKGKEISNWMWAKTTRFYEACYFKKPMITLEGTQDSYYVKDKGIGMVLNLSDVDLSVEQLSKLTFQQLDNMTKCYNKVSTDVYTYGDEHRELIKKLEN